MEAPNRQTRPRSGKISDPFLRPPIGVRQSGIQLEQLHRIDSSSLHAQPVSFQWRCLQECQPPCQPQSALNTYSRDAPPCTHLLTRCRTRYWHHLIRGLKKAARDLSFTNRTSQAAESQPSSNKILARFRHLISKMSDIVPHIVSRVLHSHRILCHRGIAIICVASTADPSIDPLEILSFRYQVLNKIYDIYNVNLTLSNHFDKNDPGLGDNYYLDIIERAVGEMDDACMELRGLFHEVNLADLSTVSRRIIESWAYATRRLPDNITIHLGSLPAITAQPLPCQILEQISIIEQYFDDIHKARTLFTEAIRRPGTLTEDWQSCGFRSRSHFIRQVLVPIAMTQFSGCAHFMRWLSVIWRKVIRPCRKEPQGFHSRDVIYNPEKCLMLGSYTAARPHRPIKLAPWTVQFRGVWTYPEVGTTLRSFIHRQEASVASRTLGTRILQTASDNPRRRVLGLGGVQGSQGRIYDAMGGEVSKSFEEQMEIRLKPRIEVVETEFTQNTITADCKSGNSKLEITRITRSSTLPKEQSYLTCPHCSIRICLPKDMDRHLKTKHGGDRKVYYCSVQNCKRSRSQRYPFDRLDNWRRHMQTSHKILRPIDTDADFVAPDP